MIKSKSSLLTLEIVPNRPIPDDVYEVLDKVLCQLMAEGKLYAFSIDPDYKQHLLNQIDLEGGEEEEVAA
jgi:hypothetical protein